MSVLVLRQRAPLQQTGPNKTHFKRSQPSSAHHRIIGEEKRLSLILDELRSLNPRNKSHGLRAKLLELDARAIMEKIKLRQADEKKNSTVGGIFKQIVDSTTKFFKQFGDFFAELVGIDVAEEEEEEDFYDEGEDDYEEEEGEED